MLSTVAKSITFGFHFLKLLSGFWNFLINIFKVCNVCLVDRTCNPNTRGLRQGDGMFKAYLSYSERGPVTNKQKQKNRTLLLKVSKLLFVQ